MIMSLFLYLECDRVWLKLSMLLDPNIINSMMHNDDLTNSL